MLKPLSGHPSQMLQPERFAQKELASNATIFNENNKTQDSDEQEFKNQ